MIPRRSPILRQIESGGIIGEDLDLLRLHFWAPDPGHQQVAQKFEIRYVKTMKMFRRRDRDELRSSLRTVVRRTQFVSREVVMI